MHPTYLTVIRVPDRAVPAEQLPKFESAPSWTRRGWVGVYRGLGDKPSGIFPTVPRADFCLVSIPYDKLCSGADPTRRGHLILREVCLESEKGTTNANPISVGKVVRAAGNFGRERRRIDRKGHTAGRTA